MKIEESNKLIAEFMGYESYLFRNYTMFILEENNHRTDIDLHYHSSWDWLMPVVEKCLLGIGALGDSYDNDKHYANIHDSLWAINIEEVHSAIVNFIKWYNKQEETKC